MMRGARFITLVCLVLSVSAVAATEPTLSRTDENKIVLSGLPPILADSEVAPELRNGLTTTFLFRASAPAAQGGKAEGAARVEIRYELWDEVFLVTALDGRGEPQSEILDSSEALAEWWSGLQLVILDGRKVRDSSREARVALDVLPFSRSEELDTQRWYAESVSRADSGLDDGNVRAGGGGGMEQVFTLLVATSIQRRPLTSFDWTIALPAPEKKP